MRSAGRPSGKPSAVLPRSASCRSRRTAVSACGRSPAPRCGRPSCSAPSSEPRDSGRGRAHHGAGPRGAGRRPAALRAPDAGAPRPRARGGPPVADRRVDAGKPRVSRRHLPGRRPPLHRAGGKRAPAAPSRRPAVGAPGDESIDELYLANEHQHAAIHAALAAGSPEGARALAREHVLALFRLLETILQQVGGARSAASSRPRQLAPPERHAAARAGDPPLPFSKVSLSSSP